MTKYIITNHFDTNTYTITKVSKTIGGDKKVNSLLKTSSKLAADKFVSELKAQHTKRGTSAQFQYVSSAYGSATTITAIENI